MSLSRIKNIDNEKWVEAVANIEQAITSEEIDRLEAATVEEIKSTVSGKHTAFGWSGGKDSLVIATLCKLAGVGESLFAHSELEYPAFLKWCLENKPSGCEVVNVGLDLEWLSKHKEMLFPQDAKTSYRWYQLIQQTAIRKYFRSNKLDYIIVGQMNYQTFLPKVCKDGLMMVGVRASESVQRVKYLSVINMTAGHITGKNLVYPIYDWKDNDVWLYIKEHRLEFPQAYIDLYCVGVKKSQLRLCNFFASESIAGLRYIAETDPDLWNKIQKREPNAYLALLYWDSEMFHRSTAKRKALESGEPQKDYKALCKKVLFNEPHKYFTNSGTRRVAHAYRMLYIKGFSFMQQKHFKKMYEAIIAGDPKLRSLRAIYTDIFTAYTTYSKLTDQCKVVNASG